MSGLPTANLRLTSIRKEIRPCSTQPAPFRYTCPPQGERGVRYWAAPSCCGMPLSLRQCDWGCGVTQEAPYASDRGALWGLAPCSHIGRSAWFTAFTRNWTRTFKWGHPVNPPHPCWQSAKAGCCKLDLSVVSVSKRERATPPSGPHARPQSFRVVAFSVATACGCGAFGGVDGCCTSAGV